VNELQDARSHAQRLSVTAFQADNDFSPNESLSPRANSNELAGASVQCSCADNYEQSTAGAVAAALAQSTESAAPSLATPGMFGKAPSAIAAKLCALHPNGRGGNGSNSNGSSSNNRSSSSSSNYPRGPVSWSHRRVALELVRDPCAAAFAAHAAAEVEFDATEASAAATASAAFAPATNTATAPPPLPPRQLPPNSPTAGSSSAADPPPWPSPPPSYAAAQLLEHPTSPPPPPSPTAILHPLAAVPRPGPLQAVVVPSMAVASTDGSSAGSRPIVVASVVASATNSDAGVHAEANSRSSRAASPPTPLIPVLSARVVRSRNRSSLEGPGAAVEVLSAVASTTATSASMNPANTASSTASAIATGVNGAVPSSDNSQLAMAVASPAAAVATSVPATPVPLAGSSPRAIPEKKVEHIDETSKGGNNSSSSSSSGNAVSAPSPPAATVVSAPVSAPTVTPAQPPPPQIAADQGRFLPASDAMRALVRLQVFPRNLFSSFQIIFWRRLKLILLHNCF